MGPGPDAELRGIRVAVLGVGLIGGSVGLAARQRLEAEVVGFDRSAGGLEKALEVGAIDRGAGSVAEACEGAGLIVCAAPVGELVELATEALASSGEGCPITDVGSTKRHLVDSLSDRERFIGGHPLAGAETSGVANARADLFEGARWYLTPGPGASGVMLDRLRRFVTSLGARPRAIGAEVHDRAIASASHLPHVFANVLAERGGEGTRELGAVAPSLRDATRVAGSNPGLWGEILSSNREAVVEAIGAAIESLGRAAEEIRSGDPERITAWQAAAAESRRRLGSVEPDTVPTHEIRVLVPNRPGVLAELSLALGADGVNIIDMSLEPAADMSKGSISIWVSGAAQAEIACRRLEGLGHPFTVADESGEAVPG